MRKFLILLLLISSPVFAEIYVVEREDGGVSIVNYFEGSEDSLADVLKDNGLLGRPIRKLNPGDLPESREDRKYWKVDLVTKKVVVDQAKKTADQVKKIEEEEEKQVILDKIGVTETEIEKVVKDVIHND